ncbi:discoidin domain-containing protein [Paenibacillus allorhizosphaerae]|uniref:F5/8 type C domain-containing protein n=1 Tax=Paenibacillus allorhizosphaerae TaxID=2849866 RepID=A0ABM8VP48_9BACL|nr:discoidin domain-containing protein [Paenibacillus allorhizosphaerae]CAG7652418.1 hypothetical protein PAECIP111802_05208 [Paenibacillus allorhizosphaerae]
MWPNASHKIRWYLTVTLLFHLVAIAGLAVTKLFSNGKSDKPILISLNKPVTSISSEKAHEPAFAMDGDATSYWASSLGSSGSTWMQVDLESIHTINRIRLSNWVDGKRFYHYHIVGSTDGTNWFPIAVKSDDRTATDEGDQFIVEAVAQYVRVYITHNSANNSAHISDFKVYGHPLPTKVVNDALPLEIEQSAFDRELYSAGQPVNLKYNIRNPSKNNKVKLSGLHAKIFKFGDPYFLQEIPLESGLTVLPGQSVQLSANHLWTIPSNIATGSYGIYLQFRYDNGYIAERYANFIRIVSGSERTVYHIDKHNFKGFDVYTLDGGMSAEYAVQKSAEMLGATVSHTWYVSPKGGTYPVYGTRPFLQQSIKQTVDFYNKEFGMETPFDTVIISTGVMPVSYLSRTMKALVLPLQYLVSLDTIKELRTMLQYANDNGIPSFASIGYARSMPMTGVAWMKLLGLPKEYKDFLNQHQVKHVVLMGADETNGGEDLVKKVVSNGVKPTGTDPGDIYVVYKQRATAEDIAWLNKEIKDFGEVPLEKYTRHLSDWEGGVIKRQIDQFSDDIKASTGVREIVFVTGRASLGLYDLPTFAVLEFMKKNEEAFSSDGPIVRGVTLSPYLLSHPFYETTIQYVPLVYYQGNTTQNTIDLRLNEMVRNAVRLYFPNTRFEDLKIWINASRNTGGSIAEDFKKSLSEKGFLHIEEQNYGVDEEWKPEDGMDAPTERIVEKWVASTSPEALKEWDYRLAPLSIEDLKTIARKYPNVSVTSK